MAHLDTSPHTLAESLDALDAAAARLTVAAIALSFPRSLHLIYAHLPNRAITLGRFLTGGGIRIGVVGYLLTTEGPEAFAAFFPEHRNAPHIRNQLHTAATALTRARPRSYLLLPGAPPTREQWPGTHEDLLDQAQVLMARVSDPRMVFALDDGPEIVPLSNPIYTTRIHQLLTGNATPLGIIGSAPAAPGPAPLSFADTAHTFAPFRGTPWVTQYLAGVLEVLHRMRWANGDDARLVPPSQRPPSPRTHRDLLALLETFATTLQHAALVLVLDHGPDTVLCQDPDRTRRLTDLLRAGGTPIGVIGHHAHGGRSVATSHIFPEYQDSAWATAFLQGMTDRLQASLNRLVPANLSPTLTARA